MCCHFWIKMVHMISHPIQSYTLFNQLIADRYSKLMGAGIVYYITNFELIQKLILNIITIYYF